MIGTRIDRRAALLAVALGFAGLGSLPATSGQSAPSTTAQATIVDFAFQPGALEVDVGTTVSWKNEGKLPHVATDRGGTFDTQPILPGATGSVTFTVPGIYSYFCRIHPGQMDGAVVVKGPSETARVNRIEAKEFSFTPGTLSVATGSLILLANVGSLPHTLTATDGSFDTGVVTPGAARGRFAGNNAAIAVPGPGTFSFVCRVHPETMKGTLIVTGPPAEAPPIASAAAGRRSIRAVDFAFRPTEASVASGGTVTWINDGDEPHTATFNDMQLSTKVIPSGKRATLKAPAAPGSYSYFCEVHPTQMRGVLVVVGANMADPTRTAAGRAAARAGAAGEGGAGLSFLAIVTGVAGAFAGGIGFAAFARTRMGARQAPRRRGAQKKGS